MTTFRKQTLSLLFAAAVLAAPAALTVGPSAAYADDKKEGAADTPLQKQMEIVEEGMKKLRKSLRKADENAASLKTIADIKKASVASRDLIPDMAKTLPEAERAKFVENYKKDMDAYIADIDKLEAAVKAGKTDEAVEIHKKLGEHKDSGHEKYTK